MSQQLNHLPHKLEDLSLVPQHPWKWVGIDNSSLMESRGRRLPYRARWLWRIYISDLWIRETALMFKVERLFYRERILILIFGLHRHPLCIPYTHTHTQKHGNTHMYTHHTHKHIVVVWIQMAHRPIGSDTTRRCVPVGGSVSLRLGFEVSGAQARPSVSLFFLSIQM